MMRKILKLSTLICFSFSMRAVELNITQPGLYELGDNLTSLPGGADDTIVINASDVVFDMNSYFIAQGNVTAGVNGIIVNSGLSNVTIKNGMIRSFTGTGIIVNQSCARISFDSITIEGCGSAISFAGSGGNVIADIFINNCSIYQCNATGGAVVDMTQCTRATVNNLIISDIASTGLTVPLSLSNVTVSDFKNILIQANASASAIFAINELSGIDNTFDNVIIRNNTGGAGFSGIRVTGATGDIFNNCLITLNFTNGDFIGFNISANQSSVYERCRITANTGTNNNTGFNFINVSNLLSVIDCIVNANVTNGAMNGYLINNANFSSFLRNMAISNTSTGGIAIGINLEGSGGSGDAFVDSYVARNNGVSSGFSFGVNVSAATTTLFTRTTSFNNGFGFANQIVGIAAGSVVNLVSPGSNNMNSTSLSWTNLGVNA